MCGVDSDEDEWPPRGKYDPAFKALRVSRIGPSILSAPGDDKMGWAHDDPTGWLECTMGARFDTE